MKDIILAVLIVLAIYFGIVLIASLIGRAKVYFDQENTRRTQVCLEKGVSFQDCYRSIYDSYAFRKE